MAQENVDLLLRACDAWNRSDLAATIEMMAEDFEFRPALVFFDLDPLYRGHEGWREFWKIWRDAWETVSIRVERVEDLDDGAYAIVVFEGIGRGSGAPVSMSFGQLWSFRDGLVERIDVGEPDQSPDLARD